MMEQRLSTHADGFEIQMCSGMLHDLERAGQRLSQDLSAFSAPK
jgi:hypothetical protein